MNTVAQAKSLSQRGSTAFGRTKGGFVGGFVGLLLTVGAGVAVGQEAPPPSDTGLLEGPQLSIAIDNGGTATKAGATLTYTITVQNLGTADVRALEVVQSVPAGLKVKSVDSSGTARGGDVTWGVNLEPTAKATFRSTMTVVDTPPDLLRLATVACAKTSATDPPIVCATHSDQLPAGAAAEATRTASSPDSASSNTWWWYVAGAVSLVIVVLAAFLLYRRGRTSHQEQ